MFKKHSNPTTQRMAPQPETV